MLIIVGTRIYIHEGDNCSFPVMYKDKEDELHNFKATDNLTLTIRHRDTHEIILVKIAESILLNEEECTIFSFDNSDFDTLVKGDYIYELVLDTDSGSTHTLVDNAYINVLKDNTPNSLNGEFEPRSLVSIDSDRVCLSEVPLICKFNYVNIKRKDAEGTLIMYDESVYDKESTENIPEDEDDNTLILFNILDPEEDPVDTDTLILF